MSTVSRVIDFESISVIFFAWVLDAKPGKSAVVMFMCVFGISFDSFLDAIHESERSSSICLWSTDFVSVFANFCLEFGTVLTMRYGFVFPFLLSR